MAKYQICKRCGKRFDSQRNTGVSFLLKTVYCSRRCENVSKKNDSDYYNKQKGLHKILFIVAIIILILLGLGKL